MLDGRSGALRADTAAMVAARARVHDADFFAPVVDAVARRAAQFDSSAGRRIVLDAGAGGGHHLRAAVEALTRAGAPDDEAPENDAPENDAPVTKAPEADGSVLGIGLDLSKYCARAIARGRGPLAAVVADVWRGLPVADDAVSVVLSVFAPRNAPEFARVLAPGGGLVVVSPAADHLAEIIEPMQMLRVDSSKSARLHAALDDGFELVDETLLRYTREIDAQTIGDLVAMGPSAFHSDEADIRSRAEALAGDGTVRVTVSVVVTVCRPAADRSARPQRRTDS
nr:methyltransferase type 11 [Gordonia sp. 'Campus']